MNKLMRKPGEDPIMTPAQLEALESDLRERAKPLGDRHWIDGTQRLASDLADVVAHLRGTEQDAEQGFHDAQQAANADPPYGQRRYTPQEIRKEVANEMKPLLAKIPSESRAGFVLACVVAIILDHDENENEPDDDSIRVQISELLEDILDGMDR